MTMDQRIGREVVEGYARVVAVDGATAWLEPEPAGACGGCKAKAGCGTTYLRPKGASRFAVPNDFHARPGEQVVVGIDQSVLTRAALVAYVLPVVALVAAAVGAALLGAGDAGAAMAAGIGLLAGIAVARHRAAAMAARGDLRPVVLRRAPPGQDGACSIGRDG